MTDVKEQIEYAARLLGGKPELARRLNVAESTLRQWVSRGAVPPKKAKRLEELTGIPRSSVNEVFR